MEAVVRAFNFLARVDLLGLGEAIGWVVEDGESFSTFNSVSGFEIEVDAIVVV